MVVLQVRVFYVMCFLGWIIALFVVYWVMTTNDGYYKILYICSCIVMEMCMGATVPYRTQNKLVFTWLNRIVGAILISSATQLLEISLILFFVICICIKFPEKVYNFITCH